MKILTVTTDAAGAIAGVAVGADSALLRHGEPLFLDGGAETVEIAPAVRMGRLGTHIPAAHALSYVDGMTLLLLHRCKESSLVPWGACDRAFAPGRWLDFDGSGTELAVSVEELYSGEVVVQKTIAWHPDALAATIHILSQKMTFKTGDLIVFRSPGLELPPPRPDTRVKGRMGAETVLDVKLK